MKSSFYLVLGTATILFLGACKKEKNDQKDIQPEPVTITITSNDRMSYDKNAFEIKKEQEVKFTHKNGGTIPKEAMGHNFVLVKKGTDVKTLSMAAAVSKATDYIPANYLPEIIAHTRLLGPGEVDYITFKIKESGEYDYLCTFPGHYLMESGKLSVK